MELKSLKKIVVTGGAGFLGRHVCQELEKRGVQKEKIYIPRSANCDLRQYEQAAQAIAGADLVFHLAAKVGGIGFNQKYPGELYFDNASMGLNLIEASRKAGVKKFVMAGTICAYPRHTPTPFREEDLWNGYPEETNAPYGVAKKSLMVMLQSYRAQYGFNGLFLLPVNLYGPYDNFDLENSHVIPALIRKFLEAKERGDKHVSLWGDGSPTREFFFVEDAARALVMAAEKFDSSEPVNLGSGNEISIKNLAELIRDKVGFKGEISWDTTRPNGQERRQLDVSKAEKYFGFRAAVSFADGLQKTIDWYLAQRKK